MEIIEIIQMGVYSVVIQGKLHYLIITIMSKIILVLCLEVIIITMEVCLEVIIIMEVFHYLIIITIIIMVAVYLAQM